MMLTITQHAGSAFFRFHANGNQNCEEPVKGHARWRGSLRSPLTEPSQLQSTPPLWKRKKKIEMAVPQFPPKNGEEVMNAQVQPSNPNDSLIQSRPYLATEYAWLTTAEAAKYLGFKVRTIHLWARQGKLKGYALTGTQRRVWRFLQSDLDATVMHRKPVLSSAQPSVLASERR